MRSTTTVVVCALALGGGLALAQEHVAVAQADQNRVFVRAEVGTVPHATQDMVVMTFGEKAVNGKPYSADGITEFTQKLADGTTISRKNTSSVYRDSQGRTRREQTIAVIGPWQSQGEPPKAITIFDPVAKETITLNPKDKIARKMPLPPPPPPPPAGVPGGNQPTMVRKEVRVQVQGGEGQPQHVALAGPMFDVMMHSGPGNSKTEDLGTSTIEGLAAQGTRITQTIPAGAIGNDRPITTVSTRWYSPDLATVLMSETDDPLAGKTVFKLTNVRQGEPPADLFQIPPDYTVRQAPEGPGKVMMRYEPK